MDGNGRWAEMRGLPRHEGHLRGVESVRTTVRSAVRCGVRCLTLYAFSTENWDAPPTRSRAHGAVLHVRGGRNARTAPPGRAHPHDRRPQPLRRRCGATSNRPNGATECLRPLSLVLALDYSARSELVTRRAQRWRAAPPQELSRPKPSTNARSPKPSDRGHPRSGPDRAHERRTAAELTSSLWQAAYAELCGFPEVLWPDFGEEEFDRALAEYARRDRRFRTTEITSGRRARAENGRRPRFPTGRGRRRTTLGRHAGRETRKTSKTKERRLYSMNYPGKDPPDGGAAALASAGRLSARNGARRRHDGNRVYLFRGRPHARRHRETPLPTPRHPASTASATSTRRCSNPRPDWRSGTRSIFRAASYPRPSTACGTSVCSPT